MGCEWEVGRFNDLKSDFEKNKREIADIDRSIYQIERIIDVENTEVARKKDALYYLDREIQDLARDRKSLESQLDALADDDWKQRDIKYKIKDLEDKIEYKRREQHRMGEEQRRLEHEVEGARRDRASKEREKTEAQQFQVRLERELHTQLEKVRHECGDYQGLSIPR